MTTIWSQTERHDQIRNKTRMERFTRLVAAYQAAERWELHNSAWLFWQRLLQLGAFIGNDGNWHIDEPPAHEQPY